MRIQSIPWLHPFESSLPWEQLAICRPFPLPEDLMGLATLTRSSTEWTTSSSLFSASAFSISSLVRSDRFSGSLWAALTSAATWSSMLNPSSPSCSSSGKSSWLIGSYPCPSSPASSTSSDSSPESGSNTLKIEHVYDTVATSEFYLRCLWWGHRGIAPVWVRHIVQPWHLFHLCSCNA